GGYHADAAGCRLPAACPPALRPPREHPPRGPRHLLFDRQRRGHLGHRHALRTVLRTGAPGRRRDLTRTSRRRTGRREGTMEALAGSPWFLPAAGAFAGTAIGFAARRQHFCTMSALERHWYAGDNRGLRTWVLAAAIALVLTQILAFAGYADIAASFYL